MESVRRSRSKIRKPKFLSLRVVLSPENSQTSSTPMSSGDRDFSHYHDQKKKQQLNLFPLHPETLIEDREIHDDNVSFILNAAASSESLHGLNLLPKAGDSTSSEEEAVSFPYGRSYSGEDENSGSLLRSAMRRKERDASDEKWVSYSEVVEEVSSSAADLRRKKGSRGGLLLRLDYEGILNAWSDQAPLFIKGEAPQTVPDLHDDHHRFQLDHLSIVPEMVGKEGWKKRAEREASLLRYKEKRQSRLFSKKIRYEVRKLNAQKRPRFKGRFVKRD